MRASLARRRIEVVASEIALVGQQRSAPQHRHRPEALAQLVGFVKTSDGDASFSFLNKGGAKTPAKQHGSHFANHPVAASKPNGKPANSPVEEHSFARF